MSKKSDSPTRWREKMLRPPEPKIVDIPLKMQERFGSGRNASHSRE